MAEKLPLISVVTPSFNQGEFLEATIRSVLDQRYPNLEYVVIDGGSTDASLAIIQRHETDLAYWVSERDRGHADALNKGFAKTNGEIMCWINSSDLYYPWTFATVAEVFAQLPSVEWIMGVPSIFDVESKPRAVGGGLRVNFYDILAGDYRWIQQESVFWRRSLWDRAGGRLNDALRCAADFELWLRFFRLAPLYVVDTVLGGFRVHGDRLAHAGNGQYEREAKDAHACFVASYDRCSLRRARLIRLIGPGNRRIIGEWLHKRGLLPWYVHPRVVFDHDRMEWSLRW